MLTDDQELEAKALESRARRAAKRVGLMARKSRRFRHSYDNQGGFMILDPVRNHILAGERCELTAQQVIEFCAQR